MKLHGVLSVAALSFALSASIQAEEKVLYFYNWSEYIPPGLLEQFTEETGIKVLYSTYESNESMYAKLKTYQDSSYDLVVPSTYFVAKMRDEGMLQKIDHNKLSHFDGLDPALLNKPYDPGNEYSIPYVWGATGIGLYTDDHDPADFTSWKDLWNPDFEGELLLMDDAREVFHMALVTLGYSGNSTSEDEIMEAYALLQELMPNVLVFNSDTPGNPYLAGDVTVGMLWNGSAFAANQEDESITLVYPKEGGIFWMDNLAISASAKNVDAAHQMIDFLLRPEIAAQVAEETGYPSPVLKAKDFMSEETRNSPLIFPSQDEILNGEFQNSVGEMDVLYEQLFERLKSSQ